MFQCHIQNKYFTMNLTSIVQKIKYFFAISTDTGRNIDILYNVKINII